MDEITYRMLRKIRRAKKYPVSQITDRRIYGHKLMNEPEGSFEIARLSLTKNEYIAQYPIGWYYVTTLGNSEFKKARWKRRGDWWLKNYVWILGIIGAILTVITIYVSTRATK